jgi:hypothetical protein
VPLREISSRLCIFARNFFIIDASTKKMLQIFACLYLQPQ